MKKITSIFLAIFIAFSLMGCNKSEADIYGTPEFKDKTVQTSLDVQNKLTLYIDRVDDINDKYSYDHSYENESTTYQRDELPESIPFLKLNSTSIRFDEFSFLLSKYKIILEENDFFEENVFNDYQTIGYNLKLKIKLENDQLYIQAYEYRDINEFDDKSVSATLIYLNLVDDKLYFQCVKDYHATYGVDSPIASNYPGNQTFYDKFIEDGDNLSILVDHTYDNRYSYELHTAENPVGFLFFRSGSMFGVLVSNKDNSKRYTFYANDEEVELDDVYTSVLYITDIEGLKFTKRNLNSYEVSWNLMEVDGWDKLAIKPEKVYKNDQEILTDLPLNAMVGDFTQLRVSMYVSEDQLTDNLLSLSGYGLSYDLVSAETLLEDIGYLQANYMDVLSDYGLENDSTKDKEYLLTILPFNSDQDLIDELFDILEQS
ncbi:hypothetical protein [Mariniplasma anaerobium]|uniref:Lipoprotein n=1 Tax=Mariniplasma anaerobium TaxID=2735436 RepID=A0A7U9TGG7_9MOLU|nr:hypothetical protein [Mariniplasma anaerobium]BCR35656.1 hypothetical protein MPAN_005490 [Mariniplasma anaerobium]